MLVDRDQVFLGGRAGQWVGANASSGDAAQVTQEIGDRFKAMVFRRFHIVPSFQTRKRLQQRRQPSVIPEIAVPAKSASINHAFSFASRVSAGMLTAE